MTIHHLYFTVDRHIQHTCSPDTRRDREWKMILREITNTRNKVRLCEAANQSIATRKSLPFPQPNISDVISIRCIMSNCSSRIDTLYQIWIKYEIRNEWIFLRFYWKKKKKTKNKKFFTLKDIKNFNFLIF